MIARLSFLLPLTALASSVLAEPRTVVLTTEEAGEAGPPTSQGFELKELSFDSESSVSAAKALSGSLFEAFVPGNVWHGELPGFIAPELTISGEEVLPCTGVYENGGLLYAHYGTDHYQTKAVSVIDETRKEVLRATAFSIENISRLIYDQKNAVLYFTVVEWNISGPDRARLHAFSIEEEKELWRSGAGTAHGNFLVKDKHILTHYGFTGEDDFVFVLDKGTGETLKKQKVRTAPEVLFTEGSRIVAPCYTGVYEFSFTEK